MQPVTRNLDHLSHKKCKTQMNCLMVVLSLLKVFLKLISTISFHTEMFGYHNNVIMCAYKSLPPLYVTFSVLRTVIKRVSLSCSG